MNRLKEWMQKSTTEQKERLAELAGSSVPSLRLAANGYRTEGVVDLTAEFAGRIADAAAQIPGDQLPDIGREDLCKACSTCPYAKAHNK